VKKEESIETSGSPISKTSNQCTRSEDDDDAKYIVPKLDLTYSLRDEEDKEEVINVMPSAGKICKSNRIKNPPSVKLDDFLWSIKIRIIIITLMRNVLSLLHILSIMCSVYYIP
jgi:hypothetical protein